MTWLFIVVINIASVQYYVSMHALVNFIAHQRIHIGDKCFDLILFDLQCFVVHLAHCAYNHKITNSLQCYHFKIGIYINNNNN